MRIMVKFFGEKLVEFEAVQSNHTVGKHICPDLDELRPVKLSISLH